MIESTNKYFKTGVINIFKDLKENIFLLKEKWKQKE